MPVKSKRSRKAGRFEWATLDHGSRFVLATGCHPERFDKAVMIRTAADLEQTRLDNEGDWPATIDPRDFGDVADWLRGPADDKAVASGCTFDLARAAYAVWWIQRHCRLYEGSAAGRPLILAGCGTCADYGLPEGAVFGRLRCHAECHAAGHRLGWQLETVARMFGWTRYSETNAKSFAKRFTQGDVSRRHVSRA